MKKYKYLFTALLIVMLISCRGAESSLDEVKKFQPEDKYFKASLVSLHFQIETSDIPTVDKIFQQVVAYYSIPADASGCADGV